MNPVPPEKRHLQTIPTAAAMLSISESSMRRLVRSGAIRTVRIGRNVRIETEALREYAERSTGPTAA